MRYKKTIILITGYLFPRTHGYFNGQCASLFPQRTEDHLSGRVIVIICYFTGWSSRRIMSPTFDLPDVFTTCDPIWCCVFYARISGVSVKFRFIFCRQFFKGRLSSCLSLYAILHIDMLFIYTLYVYLLAYLV